MKLKKRQFARLKDIAEEVNHIIPGTGIKLDKLIADIESVQKVKTIGIQTVQENPVPLNSIYAFAAGDIFDKHRKSVEDSIRKEHESMVAAITDESTTFNGGLRDAVEALSEPKIGDVGYFWDESCVSAVFGKIDLILESFPVKYQVVLNGEFVRNYSNFSKTPPELK